MFSWLRSGAAAVLLAASLTMTLLLGIATLVANHPSQRAAHARDQPAHPLTDAEATAQVVDAAVQVVDVAGLEHAAGGYAFLSCKNSQDPPYQAVVYMTFALPQRNSVRYLDDVASALAGVGWSAATASAEYSGKKLTRDGLLTAFHRNSERADVATMRIYGECRVISDHRADDPVWTELNSRLRRGG